MHSYALMAVARRQLGSFLGNPLGYIFILAFVCLTGVLIFWPDAYYRRGIADLWYMAGAMPMLLAVLLPALSMGSWTSEREQGTDELVLTLPMSTADAVIGKYLAIAAFFTIALIANLSNVIVLGFLGDPDIGLQVATFIGWWFCGLAFAAVSLWASVQVRSPAIAFVLGVIYCAVLLLAGWGLEWMQPFTRGLLSFGNMLIALAVVANGLGLCVITLSARLWRAESEGAIAVQIANLVLAVVLAVNVGRIASRAHWDADISADDITSMSAASAELLADIETPVEVRVFISHDDVLRNISQDVRRKADEIIRMLTAIEREAGGNVTMRILRPKAPTDEAALQAENEFELQPRQLQSESIAGKDLVEVYLSAVITASDITQTIEYFDPGLSVEYELVRAIDAVDARARKDLPVLGILESEVHMTEQFDFQSRQPTQAWAIVEEWRRQYEVRDIQAGADIPADIDVLVVPMPSSLTQEGLEDLHEWIWAGGPALLMEDPFPANELGQGRAIAPALSPFQPPMGGQPPPEPEPKGDVVSLYETLGLRFDVTDLVWSDFQPNRDLSFVPRTYVWSTDQHDGIVTAPATTDLDLLLTMFPGAIYPDTAAEASDLKHQPLLTVNRGPAWGRKSFDDFIQMTPYGPQSNPNPGPFIPEQGDRPWLAVEISGRMPRAFATGTPAADAEDAEDADADGQTGTALGDPSPEDIHVIVLADMDMATDAFYNLYRGIDQRETEQSVQKVLASLANVQFMANAVDVLAGQSEFLAIRSRRPEHRPLDTIRAVVLETDAEVLEDRQQAQEAADEEIAEAQAAFDRRLEEINQRQDTDAMTKANLVKAVRDSEQRKLERRIAQIQERVEQQARLARGEQARTLDTYLTSVKLLAIGVPALFLIGLVVVVVVSRLARERTDIPHSRMRSAA
ncbi:MAG: Gldg family protein [Planctomycetota bacterium]